LLIESLGMPALQAFSAIMLDNALDNAPAMQLGAHGNVYFCNWYTCQVAGAV
jgi:hypothetical protein